jgi:hypothetical protein
VWATNQPAVPSGARNLGRIKPKEAHDAVSRLIPGSRGSGFGWRAQSLEGRAEFLRKRGRNPMRDATFERTYGAARGAKPRRVNPKSGIGMKQARQVVWGAKRREGEKP